MNQFFSAAEAADWLSRNSNSQSCGHDVFALTKRECLPICFVIDDELTGVTIRSPDGTQENNGHVILDGIVKSLVPPVDNKKLLATSVQIIESYSLNTRIRNGVVVTLSELPTDGPRRGVGFIKPGYRATGEADFLEIESSEWLFHIDDLQKIIGRNAPEKKLVAEGTIGKFYVSDPLAEKAWNLGEAWMQEEVLLAKAGNKRGWQNIRAKECPGIDAVAKFVAQEFKNQDLRGRRDDYLDWQTIKKWLTGMTGKKRNGQK